jgi:hypothetical protein
MYPTVIVFSLFIVDATYTLMARISKGYHAFAPHQEFGFHRLILRGWSHSQATSLYLAIICFWSIPMLFGSGINPKGVFLSSAFPICLSWG